MCNVNIARNVRATDDIVEARRWLKSGAAATREYQQPKGVFSVLTMNILAEGLSLESFIETPPAALEWSHRRKVTTKSLLWHTPDVICLQELNYFDYFKTELEKQGYSGQFSEKTQSPCTMYGYPKDGCAIFIKNSKFQRVRPDQRVPYTGFPQVFHVAFLKKVESQNSVDLIVITTHLKSSVAFEDVRMKETAQLLKEVDKLRKEYNNVPVIIAGDFNTTVEGPVYAKLKETCVSVYGRFLDEAKSWTTWKIRANGEIKRTIDYIFASKEIEIVDALGIPNDEVIPESRLPSTTWPSDHMSLVGVFRMTE